MARGVLWQTGNWIPYVIDTASKQGKWPFNINDTERLNVIHRKWTEVPAWEHQLTHIHTIFTLIKMYQTDCHAGSLSHSFLNVAAEVYLLSRHFLPLSTQFIISQMMPLLKCRYFFSLVSSSESTDSSEYVIVYCAAWKVAHPVSCKIKFPPTSNARNHLRRSTKSSPGNETAENGGK